MKDELTEEDLLETIHKIERQCSVVWRRRDDSEQEMREAYRELDKVRINLQEYLAKREARL